MNTENIEARLCDYIEGQLDDAGRAEIEQHLQTNPQHRQLLVELGQTRDWVRDLPRQSAPAEILDSLQSQLERSLLLHDDAEQSADVVLHVRRLPQFAAIAAMMLLAVGLAAVIYYVLPPVNVNQPQIVSLPPAPRPPLITAQHPALKTAQLPGEQTVLNTPSSVLNNDVFTLSRNLPPMSSSLISHRGFGPFGSITVRSSSPGRLLVVVTTPDPRAANSELTEYLARNSLQWHPLDQSMPAPLEMQQMVDALAARYRRQHVSLRPSVDARSTETRGQAYDIAAAVSPAARDAQRGSVAMKEDAEEAFAPGAMFKDEARAEATPYATAQPVPASRPADRVDEPALPDPFAQPTQSAAQQLIVVRNVTKDQARQLSATMSNRRLGQRAEMIEPPDFLGLPPAANPYELALVEGAVAAATRPATAPATQPADSTSAQTLNDVVDVVVVVQDADEQPPTAGPATQPVDLHLHPAPLP